MVKKALAFVLFLGISFSLSAEEQSSLVRFKGGTGVIPVSGPAGVQNANLTFPDVSRNVVRGVNPPGQLWTIADLMADVKADGSIKIRGKGLLLSGGNNIGTNANQSVLATLICEAAAPFTLRNTSPAGVPLAPNGNFRIDDVLQPAPPSDCASPVLLIRNLSGVWFAAGIRKQEDDEDD